MGPYPVEDAEAWEEAQHDPGIYIYLLRQRGLIPCWWPEPLLHARPYPPAGAPFPSLPLAGGLIP